MLLLDDKLFPTPVKWKGIHVLTAQGCIVPWTAQTPSIYGILWNVLGCSSVTKKILVSLV